MITPTDHTPYFGGPCVRDLMKAVLTRMAFC